MKFVPAGSVDLMVCDINHDFKEMFRDIIDTDQGCLFDLLSDDAVLVLTLKLPRVGD
jgi:hypothetical protein